MKLGGLTPGAWLVSLAQDTIPQGYTVSAREQRLELAPGAAASTVFVLTPIVREIKMLPPLRVRAAR